MLILQTLLIGVECTRLLREEQVTGDRAGANRRGGSRTARGMRSAWSSNQQPCLTQPILKFEFLLYKYFSLNT
ncbi:MAG: hypothetical protein K0Q87_29 [Neobacillus sp.]|nr:hypothetical protein [Neobacillus sp.]